MSADQSTEGALVYRGTPRYAVSYARGSDLQYQRLSWPAICRTKRPYELRHRSAGLVDGVGQADPYGTTHSWEAPALASLGTVAASR